MIMTRLITDYTLIWDQRFVQPLCPFEPMNYQAEPPELVDHVTQAHLNEVSACRRCAPLMLQNFVQYILVRAALDTPLC